MGAVVRRRVDGDLGACVRVVAEVHRCDGYPVHWPDRPAAWLGSAASLGAWVAVREGRIAGHVGLAYGGEGDLAAGLWAARAGTGAGESAVVGRLFVAPGARGQGIGALLLEYAVRAAWRGGRRPVLDVVATDTAAVALYERLGWELLGTVAQRWGDPAVPVTVRCYAAPSRGVA